MVLTTIGRSAGLLPYKNWYYLILTALHDVILNAHYYLILSGVEG